MEDQPLTVPEWVCTLVGRLVLDNEALRRVLPIGGADTAAVVAAERSRIAEMLKVEAELTGETEQQMVGQHRPISAAGVLHHAAALVIEGTRKEDLRQASDE